MVPSNNKDSFKQLIGIFKEGYQGPGKTFAWGKAFNEWDRFGVGAIALLVVCLVFLSAFLELRREHRMIDKAGHILSLQLNEVMTFIDIGKRSFEAREELLKELMPLVAFAGPPHGKMPLLSVLLERCRQTRHTFVGAFSKVQNPFLDPEVAEAFETLTKGDKDDSFFEKKKPIVTSLQEESDAWENLCWLCNDEIKRTQDLIQKRPY